MSKIKQWRDDRMAALGISEYDFAGEEVLREQLQQELLDMADQHANFQSLAGSMHNSQYEPCDWEVVE